MRSDQLAIALPLLAVLIHFIAVLFIVLSRINYRYDLEWVEGASLIQVYRVYTGQSLYSHPTLEYIPMVYPPLYFYLAAALVRFTGLSFLPLRIISFASTIGSLIAIHFIVKEKTKSTVFALLATGSFVATFRLGGAWFDIARVDMLFVFLSLAGVYFTAGQTTRHSITAGTLFSLAFLTKQTALPIFVVLGGATFLLFRKQTLPLVGSFALLSMSSYFYLNSTTNGWYQYYVFTLPSSFQVRWSSMLRVLQAGFGVDVVVLLIGLSPLVLGFRKTIQDKLHVFFYLSAAGFVSASLIARMGHEGYDNNMLPAYAGLAILFGTGLQWLVLHFDSHGIHANLMRTAIWLAVFLQFVWLGYNPSQQIPTLADKRAGDALVAELRSVSGDVLIPYDSYLALFAGKKVYFHFAALDGLRSLRAKIRPEVKDILEQLHSTPFGLFIMDLPDKLIQKSDCAGVQNINYESASAFYPVTGYSVRPSIQYIDCP